MKRLLFLLTGGTLLMREQGSSPVLAVDDSTDLVAEVPALARIASIETKRLFAMDSSDMQPSDWVALAREVHAGVAAYDGVVVVHGTDTMAYSASALAVYAIVSVPCTMSTPSYAPPASAACTSRASVSQ